MLALLKPAKGDGAAAELPKLSLGGAGAAAVVEAPRVPKGEADPEFVEPKRLGAAEPPRAPKGEVVELASLAKPDWAKAEDDVWGFSSLVGLTSAAGSAGFAIVSVVVVSADTEVVVS